MLVRYESMEKERMELLEKLFLSECSQLLLTTHLGQRYTSKVSVSQRSKIGVVPYDRQDDEENVYMTV
jgi:hypothetical protein